MASPLVAVLGILLLLLFVLVLGVLFALDGTGLAMILGFGILVVGVTLSRKECPGPRIEYRFVPRTFQEEQENPAMVSDIFGGLFTNQEPWIHAGQASSMVIGDRVV